MPEQRASWPSLVNRPTIAADWGDRIVVAAYDARPMSQATPTISDALSHVELAPTTASSAAGRPGGSKSGEAQVHEAGTYSKGKLQWRYFLLLNAIAGTVAVAFFVGVFYADGLDPYLAGTYEWLLAHPGVTSMAAFSPLACSLLVGWGYSQRARKRKAAAKAAAEKARSHRDES